MEHQESICEFVDYLSYGFSFQFATDKLRALVQMTIQRLAEEKSAKVELFKFWFVVLDIVSSFHHFIWF